MASGIAPFNNAPPIHAAPPIDRRHKRSALRSAFSIDPFPFLGGFVISSLPRYTIGVSGRSLSRRRSSPENRIDFHNATALDGTRMLRFFGEMVGGWRVGAITVRVRYSRSADFSGACYYADRRILINIGRHLSFPYGLRTNLARAKRMRSHWYRELYVLELTDAYQLVYFIFLHELYHLLIKVARRNRRQKEGMCDRFAARVLVDRFGATVRDGSGRAVARSEWDFQNLDAFVAGACRPTSVPSPAGPPKAQNVSNEQLRLF